MSSNGKKGEYEVGFGKPPKEHQFQPGQTGNPKGRPPGSKNLKTDILEELRETLTVTEGGKRRKVTKQRAMVKSLVNTAMTGNVGASLKIVDLMLKGMVDDDSAETTPLSAEEKAIMVAYAERLVDQVRRIPEEE